MSNLDQAARADQRASAEYTFDTRYVPHVVQITTRILGWIKVAETLFSAIAFLCLIATLTFIYFKLAMLAGLIVTSLYWLLCILRAQTKLYYALKVTVFKAEVIGYGCIMALYLTVNIFISIFAYKPEEKAACAFGWFAFAAFAADEVFVVLEWRKEHSESTRQSTNVI